MTNEEFREIRNFRLPNDGRGDVLVLTQHQIVGDAVGEWVTAFTGYRSVLTHQMREWEGKVPQFINQQFKVEEVLKSCGTTKAVLEPFLANPLLGSILIHKRSARCTPLPPECSA